MKTLITTTAIVMAMAVPAFADGSQPHQITAAHEHGSSRDASVGINAFHHHDEDGSRHYLTCAAAVPYPGYATTNILYLRDNGTYLMVVRVEGGLLHIRYDENCEVTSRVFVGIEDKDNTSTTPTPTPTPPVATPPTPPVVTPPVVTPPVVTPPVVTPPVVTPPTGGPSTDNNGTNGGDGTGPGNSEGNENSGVDGDGN